MNKSEPPPGTSKSHISRTGLAIICATCIATVTLVGGARVNGLKDATDPTHNVVESRKLRFLDGPAGDVLVIDADSGLNVATFAPGSNGFLRATMRGLVRQRQLEGIGSQPPFHLVHYETGHVAVIDPETGASVALDAFGQTNAAVFARLLKEQKS